MMKLLFFCILTLLTNLSIGQVQREQRPSSGKDSFLSDSKAEIDVKMRRRDMMEKLDLTKEQKVKLKALREANKATKEEIENDAKLSPKQKMVKLKEWRRAQFAQTQSLLTENQKAKMRAMMTERFNKIE